MSTLVPVRDNWFDRKTNRWDLYHEEGGSLYLTRWHLIHGKKFKVFLHRMAGPDPDRFPHDHPWPFRSLILRGGYTEDYVCETLVPLKPMKRGQKTWGWLSWHKVPATGVWHKITTLKRTPTWTLIFAGETVRKWGFLTPNGWVEAHSDSGSTEDIYAS